MECDESRRVGSTLTDWQGRVGSPKQWFAADCRTAAILGVLAITALGVTSGQWQEFLALTALVLLTAATVGAFVESARARRLWPELASEQSDHHTGRRPWLVATMVVSAAAAIPAQSWFHAGTVIAAGDETVPEGTAWLSRLFDPWTSNIDALHAPGTNEMQLPWAMAVRLATWLGGSGGLAQRGWYTSLFVGAALAALFLLATLGLRPVAAGTGALAYAFSPYVITTAINPVFVASLTLLAGIPAVVLAVGRGRLRVGVGAAVVVFAAPLIGYVDMNPPLVGAVTLAMVVSPLVAALLGGRNAAFRSLRCMAIAVPLLIAASAYWIIPSVEQLTVVASGALSRADGWAFTQSRATVANAFWLNATWAWPFPEYFPYAFTYDIQPLALVKYLLPAVSFGALALLGRRRGASTVGVEPSRSPGADSSMHAYLPLAAAASGVSLFVIFLSTGTLFPGAILFNVLYQLPYGWLLREPGRFLMVAELGYAILLGLTVEVFIRRLRVRRADWLTNRRTRLALAGATVIGIVVIGPAYPLAMGAVVPDQPGPPLPSSHVTLPATWKDMAKAIDARPEQGGVLILPPDDFYQMPYTWGYYGSDGFIENLLHRPALVPSAQGYTPASKQLLSAVNLIATSIQTGDSAGAERVMRILGTPLVLVRGDINASFPKRTIVSPGALMGGLSRSTNFHLVHTSGALALYSVSGTSPPRQEVTSSFVTVNSDEPDLRVLAALSPDTHLVSAPPQPGVGRVIQVPGIETWSDRGNEMQTEVVEEPGWTYQTAVLRQPGPELVSGGVTTADRRVGNTRLATFSLPTGPNAIDNGDFTQGAWNASVGDCYNANADRAHLSGGVRQSVAPGGRPALHLEATLDSACEAQPVAWSGGQVLVRMQVHHLAGAPPRACLYEPALERCLPMQDLPTGNGWTSYTATATPDPGVKTLSLFVYADGESGGARTVNEYADVSVLNLPLIPQIDLIGTPQTPVVHGTQLLLLNDTYSPLWRGPNATTHYRVDGVSNGWMLVGGSSGNPVYGPARLIQTSRWVSLVAVVIAFIVLVLSARRRSVHRRPAE